MTTTLHPYLNFMGQTAEAMNFYKSIFGGELTLSTYADFNPSCSEEDKNKIMHAELKTPTFTFYCADGNAEHQVTMGDNISMSLVGDDEASLTEWFNALSQDAKTVEQPLTKAPWGDTFGSIIDKYGVRWMVNISAPGGPNA